MGLPIFRGWTMVHIGDVIDTITEKISACVDVEMSHSVKCHRLGARTPIGVSRSFHFHIIRIIYLSYLHHLPSLSITEMAVICLTSCGVRLLSLGVHIPCHHPRPGLGQARHH